MNSLEASRVLSVLDETLEALKWLSFITPEVVDTAEQLRELLGEDIVQCLVKHRSVMLQAKGNIHNEQLTASTWELIRVLKKSSTSHRLQILEVERSTVCLQVLNFFERLRHFSQKRLTTTVEEDSSNRDYYEEVKEREEHAVAEKTQLEQKLKLQRVELQKLMSLTQAAEDKARAELHDVQASTATARAALAAEAEGVRHSDRDQYQAEYAALFRELTEAKSLLQKCRDDNREAEAALRKGKKRAQQDVESVISEYDTDLGGKEAEFTDASLEYNKVIAQLEEYTIGYDKMRSERISHEEEERRVAQKKLAASLLAIRRNRAARVIQAGWRKYRARKEAEKRKARLAAKKDKAKKK